MENNLLAFSSSPHVKNPRTTKNIMIDVCIALLPACVMAVVCFGLSAFLLIAVSLASAIAFEFAYYLLMGKTFKQIASQFDYTTCVTGLLVALVMGSQTPLYVPVFANAFAIIVVKLIFGGTGKNLVNPAIAGRIFAFISFTSVMAGGWILPSISAIFGGSSFDIETGATALTPIVNGGLLPNLSNWDLFLGTGLAGCIGETCKLALIVGGIYLVIKKVITPLFPIVYIAITGLFTVCINGFDFALFLPSILSGGLILGAIFMATDYVTTPNSFAGNLIYFALLGLVTAGLRAATGMEVVSFAILLMNLFVPLIDKFVMPKPFGYAKQKKVKGEQ